jgi:hypothetical protein
MYALTRVRAGSGLCLASIWAAGTTDRTTTIIAALPHTLPAAAIEVLPRRAEETTEASSAVVVEGLAAAGVAADAEEAPDLAAPVPVAEEAPEGSEAVDAVQAEVSAVEAADAAQGAAGVADRCYLHFIIFCLQS